MRAGGVFYPAVHPCWVACVEFVNQIGCVGFVGDAVAGLPVFFVSLDIGVDCLANILFSFQYLCSRGGFPF
jgi:hypothetical protein